MAINYRKAFGPRLWALLIIGGAIGVVAPALAPILCTAIGALHAADCVEG